MTVTANDLQWAGDSHRAHATQRSSWPAPLSADAYHGLLGEIVTEIEPETEADPAAILAQMLVMFGNVIGRAAHFLVGADLHFLNLFVGVVGQSAKGRKGVSRGQAQRIFEPIDHDWARACITAGLSSGEGLIWPCVTPHRETATREGTRARRGVSDRHRGCWHRRQAAPGHRD